MSRRLLQRVLSRQAGAGYGGLANQMERAIASPAMPAYLKEALETWPRWPGWKPTSRRASAARLAPVNEGEARWLLDVLQPLFEFYYVQPARLRRKRYAVEDRIAPALPAKLEDAESASDG